MTEAEWSACADPERMLEFLRGKTSDRKLRLYALGCCRRIEHLFLDQRTWDSIREIERYAEDSILRNSLWSACQSNCDFLSGTYGPARIAAEAVGCAAGQNAWAAAWNVVSEVRRASGDANSSESEAQTTLLRHIVGNPFRHVTPNTSWLSTTVTQLAEAIYEERAFDRLPILADALEEAGCTDTDILNHCRQAGEHVRGCWVVDLLLDKK